MARPGARHRVQIRVVGGIHIADGASNRGRQRGGGGSISVPKYTDRRWPRRSPAGRGTGTVRFDGERGPADPATYRTVNREPPNTIGSRGANVVPPSIEPTSAGGAQRGVDRPACLPPGRAAADYTISRLSRTQAMMLRRIRAPSMTVHAVGPMDRLTREVVESGPQARRSDCNQFMSRPLLCDALLADVLRPEVRQATEDTEMDAGLMPLPLSSRRGRPRNDLAEDTRRHRGKSEPKHATPIDCGGTKGLSECARNG